MAGPDETAQPHWQHVYSTKPADQASWFQSSPRPSLDAIARAGVPSGASLVDVGGGASRLVDLLLDRGWSDLTVLDIADAALDIARTRLGTRASTVQWIVADITDWRPARRYDVWHDRAVFHFLIEEAQRRAYRAALAAAMRPGGHVILATFAADGPERCSGLPVRRYAPEALAAELGDAYELVESWAERHTTPGGTVQPFSWCRFRRR
jgi:trans-aconitate methyltransferase